MLNHLNGSNLPAFQKKFLEVPLAMCLYNNRLPLPTRDKFSRYTLGEGELPALCLLPSGRGLLYLQLLFDLRVCFFLSTALQVLVDQWLQPNREREGSASPRPPGVTTISISSHSYGMRRETGCPQDFWDGNGCLASEVGWREWGMGKWWWVTCYVAPGLSQKFSPFK